MTVDWVWQSLYVAAVATAVSVVFGLWLARRRAAPYVAAGIALPAPVLCYCLLGACGHFWPITRPGWIVAGVVSTMPLFVRGFSAALARLDPAYGKAARSLGASNWRVFSRVELPLTSRPVLSAAGLAFARVLAELAVAQWTWERLRP
ncbi:MAG: ABC transporter permease subunit [Acidobacteriia bacterium]|nr:ABC transporter permease subunit [Terriglobia bacterium]